MFRMLHGARRGHGIFVGILIAGSTLSAGCSGSSTPLAPTWTSSGSLSATPAAALAALATPAGGYKPCPLASNQCPPERPQPAYCSTFSSVAGVPLNITDDSGLGAVLVVYVTNGSNYMDNTGNFTSATAYPLPAACFSTTVGSGATNKPLNIPTGIGGRVYFAYATPNPNPGIVPNPFGTASVSGPNVGYSTSPYPWDKIEYGTTAGATIDTTQVDALGLPLELSVTGGALPSARRLPQSFPSPCPSSASTIVGVTSCNYAKIFTAMKGISQYNRLLVTQNFNGQLIDMQVVAPKDSVAFTSFQWNLFALSTYVPTPTPSSCPATPANGYMSCVLASYDTPLAQGRLFHTSGIGALNVSGHNYCATSDGSSNFLFTDVGSATSCASATPNPQPAFTPNPFNMPIQEFTYGVPPVSDGGLGCKQAILFSQPWGNANVGVGHIFAAPDAFALWKDVTADLNRGTMLTTSQEHPVGLTSPSMSLFFQDPMSNTYAQVLHTYFDNNLAYALAYDDLGNFESGVTWEPGNSINVRINAVPTASSASSVPLPIPVPNPCPTLPTNVGTF